MADERFAAPAPEVQYLPTLFRKIQQGELRIPAFQREFVWAEAQILELLESVYRGFPIGSLLFWQVSGKVLNVASPSFSHFPDVEERYPLKYVLDGLQRLSCLYGVFHYQQRDLPSKFNVIFDLEAEQFRHYQADEPVDRVIFMSTLFSPREFLDAQRVFNGQKDAEMLLDRAVRLHTTFQEYMVPTVTITDRGTEDVVAIFERINSTGTKLSAVDFMRAATWSEDFDLNREIDKVSERLNGRGFELPPETLVKALAVSLGKHPTPESMFDLREYGAKELHLAMGRTAESLEAAIEFLRHRFLIQSYDYVPYEGQMLLVSRFFQLGGNPNSDEGLALERWFWTVSFNETLRGKPDHYVTRMLYRLERLIQGDLRALNERLAITEAVFTERRFTRGKALSGALASLLAVSGVRSLLTGDTIAPETFMTEFSAKNYEGLVALDMLAEATDTPVATNRMMANIVVVPEGEGRRMRVRGAKGVLEDLEGKFGDDWKSVLLSQCIPEFAAREVTSGQVLPFLVARAAFLLGRVKMVVGQED
jgi:hypothetical protein